MTANTISRITARFWRWSSAGNAAARSDMGPALRISLRALPKYPVSTAHSKQISPSGVHSHTILVLQTLLSNRRATVKSP